MLFTYHNPDSEQFPIQAIKHAPSKEENEEIVFQVRQVAAALCYKDAANMTAICHERYQRKVAFPNPETGELGYPVKSVTRYGLFFCTKISDTEKADHFHDWVRAVVLTMLDRETEPDDVSLATLEASYLQAEIERTEKRHATQMQTLNARLQDAQNRSGAVQAPPPVSDTPKALESLSPPSQTFSGYIDWSQDDIEASITVKKVASHEA